MSEAQERFNEATNDMDRAYWQGAIDGEAAERSRVVRILFDRYNFWLDKYKKAPGWVEQEMYQVYLETLDNAVAEIMKGMD